MGGSGASVEVDFQVMEVVKEGLGGSNVVDGALVPIHMRFGLILLFWLNKILMLYLYRFA